MAVAAGACGGVSDGDSATPGITESASAPGSDQQPGAAGDGESTSRGDIVLHKVNWFVVEDDFGESTVHYAAILENTGSDPAYVLFDIEAFDASGASVGRSMSMFRDSGTIGPGRRLPFNNSVAVDVAPASVEATVRLQQIPEFQHERYGRSVLEGRVVDVRAEDRGVDVMLTLLLEATNVGTAGAPFPVFSKVAIYDADGSLIDAGIVAPGFIDLCPGASAQLEANYSVSLDGFDAGAASYELYFEDVDLGPEEARCS